MAEKNSLVEEAIIQMKNLEEIVSENAKGILASTMRQEIKDLVKESLNEEDDEEEIDTDDEDVDDEDVDDEDVDDEMDYEDEEDFDSEEDMELPDDEEDDLDDEEVIDLTNEPMSTIMKVFKLMDPETEIEVKKDTSGHIHLKDLEDENEYIIMSESEMKDYTEEVFEEEDEKDVEEILKSLEVSEDEDIDYSEDEEPLYELEINDDYMMESKKSMKPKGVGIGSGPKFNYGKIMDYPSKKMKKGDEAPYVGKGPKYSFDKNSPSLKGEFKEGKYGMNKGDLSKTHKGDMDFTGKKGMMSKTNKGDMDFTGKKGMKSKTNKGNMDFEEMKEASRTYGSGSKFREGGLPKPRAHSGFNANIKKESINSQEVNLLREKNEEYRKALNIFRNKLNEVAVFNSNLAYATRLFTEQSTSKQEKINILKRFDGVETLKESKNLYRIIKDELTNSKKQQVNESIERTIQKSPSSGSAINLIESKTYENPQFLRMKDLMSKLK